MNNSRSSPDIVTPAKAGIYVYMDPSLRWGDVFVLG